MAPFNGFIGGTYQSISVNEDAQECMNLYVETDESAAGKSPRALIGTPGLTVFATLPTSPVRGIWIGEGRLFVVAGSKLYELDSTGAIVGIGGPTDHTARGDVGNDGKPVYMYPNGNQLFITSAGNAYIDNGAGPTLCTFSTGGQVTASTGAFLDGYFIAAQVTPSAKTINISSINDGTQWSSLDFAVKEGYPDNIAALLADHEELWIFGTQTTEVWRNTGAAAFPLERDPGAMIHMGCLAAGTPVRLGNGVAWLGGDPRGQAVAYAAQGFIPVRVSTHAVENAWAGYSTVSDAVAYSYEENGHLFWVINFPTGNATWVYDYTEKLWHKRGWWNGTSNDRQRGAFHGFVFNQHFLGDRSTGQVYQCSANFYDDAGTAIHRIRTAPHLSNENDRTFYSRLRFDLENSGAINPSLDWSNDGAHTWNTPRTTVSNTAGALARYDFRRLGGARDRVFRLTITAAVKVAIVGASVETIAGAQ